MQVFVIGATGWIGGAITDALLAGQHQVVGLVRSEAAKRGLELKGARAVQGDIQQLELLISVAQQADVVIVASSASLSATVAVLRALVTALHGTQKPLLYISGSSLYGDIGDQEGVDEQAFLRRLASPAMDQSPEQIVYQAPEQGVHGLVIIGAGILYGRGGGATPNFWLDDAHQRNAAWFIGAGTQRWSTVHVDGYGALDRTGR